MDISLSFTAALLWAMMLAILAKGSPYEPSREDYFERQGKRGFWPWDKSERLDSDITRQFSIYSCSLLRCSKSSEKRTIADLDPYVPYGFSHTFIKIGATCYDWDTDSIPKHVPCGSDECCYKNSKHRFGGETKCADRIGDFERAWNKERDYNVYNSNCQKYTDAMKEFLLKCYSDAEDAVPCLWCLWKK